MLLKKKNTKKLMNKVVNAIENKKNKKLLKSTNKKTGIPFIKSIKFQLIMGFLIPVIGIIILGLVSYDKASTAVVKGYQDSAIQTVDTIESYLGLVTDTVQSTYKTYVIKEDILKYFSGQFKIQATESSISRHGIVGKNYNEIFNKCVNNDPLISNIMFLSDEYDSLGSNRLDEDAKPYETFMGTENGNVVKKEQHEYHWFGNKNETIDKIIGVDSNDYAFRLAKKIDNIETVMVVDVDKKTVENTLDELDAGEGGYVGVVVDDSSEILATKNSKENNVIFYDKDFYKKAIKETNGSESKKSGVMKVKFKGKPYRYIYSRLADEELMICALISDDYLKSKVKDIQLLTLLVVVIAAIIAGVVGIVIASGISGTISKIIDGLKKVSSGDFTAEVHTKRNDEFKLITDAVNDTVGHVKNLISSVQEVNSELVQAADKVYNSSTFFVETSQNIKESVDDINKGAYKLDGDSDNCLQQMDMLSEKIEIVATNSEEIGKIAEATNTSIVAGVSSIDGVTETTRQTTKITGEVINAIEGLQEKTRSIGNIVNVINEIAEETNLISLNATIEAARVGSAGRGFGVIAKEIINLSTQSQESAGQIGKIIDEIIKKANEVVMIAKKAVEMVEVQNKSVEGTKDVFGEMKKNIDTLLISLDEITRNVVNMEGARATTLESVENISVVSAQSASSSESVAKTVESQNNAIDDLNMAANTLSSKSAHLTELLQQFTV